MRARNAGAAPVRPPDLDTVGATASTICAIHCAVMPFVVAILPLVGLSILADERVEWALVGTSALLGLGSVCWGHRQHRRRRPLAILSVGLALLAVGRISEARGTAWYGPPLLVLGGLTMAVAHRVNRRLCLSCRNCEMASEGT